MSSETVPVTVQILDKEYRVACAEHEQDALLASARYLNNRMKEIRGAGKVVGLDRIAVMAALNITHELLQQCSRKEASGQVSTSPASKGALQSLQQKIDLALRASKQLEF